MDCVADLESDVLIGLAFPILIAAAARIGIREVGFRAVILYGEAQRKSGAVSRVGKMKSLAEAIAQAGLTN